MQQDPKLPPTTVNVAANVCRGMLMGLADVVPGVSGGTVALILGIYERLVTAISHVDLSFVRHLFQRRWRWVWGHLDLTFLFSLAAGIFAGFLLMTLLINRLLSQAHTRSMTFAAFFGMILASAFVIARMIHSRRPSVTFVCWTLGVVGALFALWLTTLPAAKAGGSPSLAYIFVCGCIAICAMILPGISGAMILLVLGVYEHLTEIPHNLLHGQQVVEGLVTVLVFGVGCALSLVAFSKILRALLGRFHSQTLALLCGFMFGALPKLWPFQRDLTPDIPEFKHKTFELYWPDPLSAQTLLAGSIVVASAIAVLVVDAVSRQRREE